MASRKGVLARLLWLFLGLALALATVEVVGWGVLSMLSDEAKLERGQDFYRPNEFVATALSVGAPALLALGVAFLVRKRNRSLAVGLLVGTVGWLLLFLAIEWADPA